MTPARRRCALALLAAACGGAGAGGALAAASRTESVSVLQHHAHATRDGVFVEPRLTRAAAATLHREPAFDATPVGWMYAQPLYLAAAGKVPDQVIVATERNHVTAYHATTGAQLWDRVVGAPVPWSKLPCGNIDPLGITGTPVIDPATRTIYLDAMTTPDGGATKQHLIFALLADDGSIRPGWPVHPSRAVHAGGHSFQSAAQGARGALLVLGDRVYVPFGGVFGDCDPYRGWVVGVKMTDPTDVVAWTTRASGSGIWAPSGLASDGTSIYLTTGNGPVGSSFGDQEAIVRLPPSLAFSRQPVDFFAPTSWSSLDDADADLGGTGPVVVDVPGASPARLVLAMGKDGVLYGVDRANLGGIRTAIAQKRVASSAIINAAAAYSTARGTYVVFQGAGVGCPAGTSGNLTAVRIGAAAPPTLTVAWCADMGGHGSPAVTMTDAEGSNAIVWAVGAEGDNRLRGFDGDTGAVVFGGGGPADALTTVVRFQTPIVARGRIFVAARDHLFAFTTR